LFLFQKSGPLGPVEDPVLRGSETVGFTKKMTWRVEDPVFSGMGVSEKLQAAVSIFLLRSSNATVAGKLGFFITPSLQEY